ncbi:plant UBX domain-containing protein 1 isoform X3 [Vigna radiata var. radiata]|uniref:Plant UBX domain-containing protein 1 isoform X3 n=1 Tax=Vigna radiata var. radiata TaxID=3916 RepID=A0A3Q0EQZ2_VIGRR|nr:plant UBX domain-containing protein 1 isoform X3 [Vigna radiata var. radiata]
MVVGSCTLTSNTKRRATYKFSTDMDTEAATKKLLSLIFHEALWIFLSHQIKLDALKERAGREIRVFETYVSSSSNAALSNEEVTDDFYEFTAEDYHRLLAAKKEDKFLKTRKIREAEEAARRSEMTKAIIRVRFPDNHTLETTFHPSETVQSLIDVLTKVIVLPEEPFYIYTTPPKKIMKDMSQNFYDAGFCPGAIVYFSYDVPKGSTGPYLQEDILSLKELHAANDQGQQSEPLVQSEPEPAVAIQPPPVEQRKPAEKKLVKPKWLKM